MLTPQKIKEMIHVFVLLGILIGLYFLASLFNKKLRGNGSLSVIAIFYLIFGWIFVGEPFGFLTGFTILVWILSEYFFKKHKWLSTLVSALEIIVFCTVMGHYAYHHFVNTLIQLTQ